MLRNTTTNTSKITWIPGLPKLLAFPDKVCLYIIRFVSHGKIIVETIHKQGSKLPVEIQVVETSTEEDGRSFVGKIRHMELATILDADAVNSLWKQIEGVPGLRKRSVIGSATSIGIMKRRPSVAGKNATQSLQIENISSKKLGSGLIASQKASVGFLDPRGTSTDVPKDSSDSVLEERPEKTAADSNPARAAELIKTKSHESSLSGGSHSEGSSISGMSGVGGSLAGIDSKVAYLRESSKVDPIVRKLNFAIKSTFALLLIFLITAVSTVIVENPDL